MNFLVDIRKVSDRERGGVYYTFVHVESGRINNISEWELDGFMEEYGADNFYCDYDNTKRGREITLAGSPRYKWYCTMCSLERLKNTKNPALVLVKNKNNTYTVYCNNRIVNLNLDSIITTHKTGMTNFLNVSIDKNGKSRIIGAKSV